MSGDDTFLSGSFVQPLPAGHTFNPAVEQGDELGDPLELSVERYEVLDLLGEGGMGEVYRVRDHALGRTVALKVLKGSQSGQRLGRFREEAMVTARLQHPGVVPVHDIGRLPDGRVFFTMKEVRGHTFTVEAERLHVAPPDDFVVRLRRVVAAFQRSCEAVAFAHAAGVVHRDLKPSNIMVGGFGEVLVLDWGLALAFGGEGSSAVGASGPQSTPHGQVMGTPAYMPPEQARGELMGLGPEADVYSLGATLYTLLSLRPPYDAPDAKAMVELVAAQMPIQPPSERCGRPIPPALEQLCMDCLAANPRNRPGDASVLAAGLADWLDGAQRRARALALVRDADRVLAGAAALRDDAREVGMRAEDALSGLGPDAPADTRAAGWDLEDQARELRRHATRARRDGVQLLNSALSHDTDLVEAHARLADVYQAQHAALEADGRFDEAEALEPLIRAHDGGRYAAYLTGVGALTLVTDPPGVEADLYRYVPRRRRLEPVLERSLGRTPLVEVPLEPASYLVVLRCGGRPDVRYPVRIGRGEHWDGVPPGGTGPEPVPIPAELGAGEVYVPPGWFWSPGNVPQQSEVVPRRRVWAHGFVIQEHPVTVGEYAAFLDSLGDDDLARFNAMHGGSPVFARGADGLHRPTPDTEGDVWPTDFPIVDVSWPCARAYAEWLAHRTGRGWRLPFELEVEKAATGTDERLYPWGNHFDPSFARTKDSLGARLGPVAVGVPDGDRSPYGVHGLGGNVLHWTLDEHPNGKRVVHGRVDRTVMDGAVRRWARGGSWMHNAWFCRIAVRKFQHVEGRFDSVGFRLVRET